MLQFGGGAAAKCRAALDQRPYTARDLAAEYGLSPLGEERSGGPLGYLSRASDAHKLNNCIEAEASRIQIEYDDAAGFMAVLRPVDALRIARQRFVDQNLLKSSG